MSSRRLLSQALRGNSRAVDHLFRRYRLPAAARPRPAAALGARPADTADLVQDTLLRTFRKLPGLTT
jgi:DNA-directed RNA polymerase specialized sigma24 family protein